MRPRTDRGVGLWIALALVLVLGMWGRILMRSLAAERRALETRAAREAALDLAASAVARARQAQAAGHPLPAAPTRGPGGEAKLEAAGERWRIQVTLSGEPPLTGAELLTDHAGRPVASVRWRWRRR